MNDKVTTLMRDYLDKKKQSEKQPKTKELPEGVSDLMKEYLTKKSK